VLAERGGGIGDLAVDDEVDQILGLVLVDRALEEAELARGLLAALAEVAFVEREPQLAVFEHEVFAGAVIPASVHGSVGIICRNPARPQGVKAMLQQAL
jgi:hypothetical protein